MVGGVHGRGVHGRVHVWQGGMHGRGHAWQEGMYGGGACMAGGVHGRRDGHCSGRYASYASYAFLLTNIFYRECYLFTGCK